MQTSLPPNPERLPLAFDEIVIDFQGRRLLRSGEVRPLEHKAFDVLALLTAKPGQVFQRDDILDAVWGHRHVTPGVLNRVMTLLRQALGEDAHATRYLRTLHGVGYRFDLPEPGAFASPDAAAEIPPGPSEDSVDVPSSEHPPALSLHRVGRKRFAIIVALLIVSMAAASVWWSFPHVESTPALSNAPTGSAPTLIVIPLKPIADDDRELAAGLSDELISALAKIDRLRVIARESTGVAVAQTSDMAGLVTQLGITHALEGSLRQSGQQLRINLRLTDAHTGRMVWTQDYDRNVADVFVLEREIASAVAFSLTLELGLPAGRAGQGGDADYLRRYQKARDLLFTSRSSAAQEVAEVEFRAMAKEHPDDARVHAGLAEALGQRAFENPSLAKGLRAEALQEAELANRLDASLPEPYGVQAAAACRNDQWDRCLTLYRKTVSLAPSEALLHIKYAIALANAGYLSQAHDVIQRGILRDPLNHGLHLINARILDTLGEHDQARIAYQLALEKNLYGLWFNAIMRHDYAEAQQLAESMDDNPDDRERGPLLKKTYLAITRALVDPAAWPQAEEASREFEAKTGLWSFMRVLFPHPDSAELLRQLELLRHRSYSTWDLLLWTRPLGYLRHGPAFDDYVRRSGLLAYWGKNGFPPQCRAQGEGAVCG